jgi:hypothetical protein
MTELNEMRDAVREAYALGGLVDAEEACEHGDHPDVGDGTCPCGMVVYPASGDRLSGCASQRRVPCLGRTGRLSSRVCRRRL